MALIVPCDDPDAVTQALAAGADAFVFNLAGPPSSRPGRRAAALAALLQTGRMASPPGRMVRLAGLASGLVDDDLDAVMAGAPDAVLLPDAVGPAAIERLGAKLAVREAEHGLEAGATRIVAAPADTGAGLLALPGLARARSRLAALLWDPATLAADLGAADAESEPCRVARTMLLAASAACGVPAFEAAPDGDASALVRRRDAARRDGFAGLLLCRPGQLRLARADDALSRCAPGAR